MKTEEDWAEQVKRMVRTEMVRHGISYEDLAVRLATLGVHDTPVNMRNKLSRGKFTAVFLIQVLEAVGCNRLELNAQS